MSLTPARSRLAGLIAVLVATVFWSVGAVVAGNLFGHGIRPLELVEVRVCGTALCLGGFAALQRWFGAAVRGARRAPATAADRWSVLGLAAAVAAATTGLLVAIDLLPVAVAIVLQNLAPVFVLAVTAIATPGRLGWRTSVGVAVALAGVALVVRLPEASLHGINGPGVLFGVLAAAGVAGLSVFGERATRSYGAITATALAFTVVAVVWLLVQLPRGVPEILRQQQYFGWVAAAVLLGTVAPFALFTWGTARLGPEAGSVNLSLEPIFSALIAWLWLDQSLDAMQIVGMIAVIGGVVGMQRTQAARTDQRSPVVEPATQQNSSEA